MEEKKIKQPISEMACMHFSHLGKVLSNLSVVCVIFSLSSFVTFFIYPIIFAFWFFIVVATLGMVFVINPGFGSFFTNTTELFGNILSFIGPLIPYFFGAALITSILSIVFLSLDKYEKHWGRITFSVILIGITIIGIIALIVGGLK